MSLRRTCVFIAGLVSAAGLIATAGSSSALLPQPNPCPPEAIYSGGAIHIDCHSYPVFGPIIGTAK